MNSSNMYASWVSIDLIPLRNENDLGENQWLYPIDLALLHRY